MKRDEWVLVVRNSATFHYQILDDCNQGVRAKLSPPCDGTSAPARPWWLANLYTFGMNAIVYGCALYGVHVPLTEGSRWA